MNQRIVRGQENLPGILREIGARRLLLVCGGSFDRLPVGAFVPREAAVARFSSFTPNPRYEDVCRGVELFRREGCDAILAVGGGSAIDAAKCIKLFCKMPDGRNYLEQERSDTGVPLIALPTTAGTGSESTCHAVVYCDGRKQSVSHPSIVPDYAVLEPSVLQGLPLYQKKCTMLDALCQSIESWGSIRSTEESRGYARAAVEGVVSNWRAYLCENDPGAAARVMEAANASGRAINITATTAPHAMSYKLTSLYGLPHGHAVALCMPEVWEHLSAHTGQCADPRGEGHLKKMLSQIGAALSAEEFRELLAALEIERPAAGDRAAEIDALIASVNPERLANHPVALSPAALRAMYERIVR